MSLDNGLSTTNTGQGPAVGASQGSDTNSAAMEGYVTITPDDVDIESGVPVISAAQKFILPIPAFTDGGEPLVYPEGTEKAGQPITDWKGNEIGKSGVVFYNDKDNAWQAVPGDGTGVIIFNQATEEQALELLGKVRVLAGSAENLNLADVKEILEYAKKRGLTDRYNSDRGFIKSTMTPVTASLNPEPYLGLMKRDDRDICKAVYVGRKVQFEGPAVTAQTYEHGVVIIGQINAKTKEMELRGCDPQTFLETYRMADGSPATLDALIVQ